jgi:hypothetical protein
LINFAQRLLFKVVRIRGFLHIEASVFFKPMKIQRRQLV